MTESVKHKIATWTIVPGAPNSRRLNRLILPTVRVEVCGRHMAPLDNELYYPVIHLLVDFWFDVAFR